MVLVAGRSPLTLPQAGPLCLSQPVALPSQQENKSWWERYQEWIEIYRSERHSIGQTKDPAWKAFLIKTFQHRLAQKEIRRILETEDPRSLEFYPLFEPRPVDESWAGWAEQFPRYENPRWNEAEVESYLYHGTSLGIARVAAMTGFLGGLPALAEVREIDNQEQSIKTVNLVFFASAAYHAAENRPSLGAVIRETADYADRVTRPSRAILIYYAMRAEWERLQKRKPFPPFQDFLQRVVIRIPKGDIHGLSGTETFSQISTDQPVSLHRGEILLDRNIPIPRRTARATDHLSFEDPEYIGAFPVRGEQSPEKAEITQQPNESLSVARMRQIIREFVPEARRSFETELKSRENRALIGVVISEGDYPILEVAERLEAIGNAAMDQWVPIQMILPSSFHPISRHLETTEANL